MKEDIKIIQTTSSARDKSPDSTDADNTTSGNDPKTIRQLQQKVKQHETQLQALQASVPQRASKNDTRAGSTATPQPAVNRKRRRNKRSRQNDTESATVEPDLSTAIQPKTKRPVSQHPRPPTPNNASGNWKTANQQQRGGQHGAQRQKPDPDPTDDSAPQPPDARRRQNITQRHRHSNQRGRGGASEEVRVAAREGDTE